MSNQMRKPSDIVIPVGSVEAKLANLPLPEDGFTWVNFNGTYKQMNVHEFNQLSSQNANPHQNLVARVNEEFKPYPDEFKKLPSPPTGHKWRLEEDRWILMSQEQLRSVRKNTKKAKPKPLHRQLAYRATSNPSRYMPLLIKQSIKDKKPIVPKTLPRGYRSNRQ
ncbi:hypothetical protein M3Y97_00954500 [Aphelenchoides bicaudatus]|nr:hypothetical protein M3Y97_00954500 [Aphelenchoides bicaudatus]